MKQCKTTTRATLVKDNQLGPNGPRKGDRGIVLGHTYFHKMDRPFYRVRFEGYPLEFYLVPESALSISEDTEIVRG
jgi:hypothetical protein